jgi:hypothetical protein
MLKMKHLFWIERIASFAMFFAFGFLTGMAYPQTPLIYLVALIFIGACTKVWVHHQTQKLQRSEEQE